MIQRYLAVDSVLLVTLFLAGCVSVSPTSLPTTSATSRPIVMRTPTPVLTPTQTPAPFNIVNNPESSQISVVTLEDIQSGKLAEFEHSIVGRRGMISADPSGIDYIYWTYDSAVSLDTVKKDGATYQSVKVADFVSVYKTSFEPWGFEKMGFVVTYVYEDKNGTKALFHYILTEKQANLAMNINLFNNPSGILTAHAVFESVNKDFNYVDGKPDSKDDLRLLNKNLYPIQGYSIEAVEDLFKRISDSDTFSESDMKMLESIVFHCSFQTTNHD